MQASVRANVAGADSLMDCIKIYIGLLVFAAAISGLAVPNLTFAQLPEVSENYTAEVMYRLYRGSEVGVPADLQSMMCAFRLQGATQLMMENCTSFEDGFNPLPSLSASAPPSRGAARQAFTDFMEANPQTWGWPWHVAVASALPTTFPCEK